MNKKLHCLYVMADHAIGASNAIGAGQLAGFAVLTMKESAAYLEVLHKEGSVLRTERNFIDKAGRNCRRHGYFIAQDADIERLLTRSENISKKVRQPKTVKPQGCALAEIWRGISGHAT